LAKMTTIIISKVLSKMDTERNLVIPTSSLGFLPFEEGHSANMVVEDESTRQAWIFHCTIKGDENKGLVLSVSWLDFVRDKSLKENDEVTIFQEEFMKEKAMGTRFKIVVKRKIRLFGADIWADVI
ncbi:hypothetical protein CFOL_v3_04733, partial [Cephalotus follicularis]